MPSKNRGVRHNKKNAYTHCTQQRRRPTSHLSPPLSHSGPVVRSRHLHPTPVTPASTRYSSPLQLRGCRYGGLRLDAAPPHSIWMSLVVGVWMVVLRTAVAIPECAHSAFPARERWVLTCAAAAARQSDGGMRGHTVSVSFFFLFFCLFVLFVVQYARDFFVWRSGALFPACGLG